MLKNQICLRQSIPSFDKLNLTINHNTYQHQIKIRLPAKYPKGKSSTAQSNSKFKIAQKPVHSQKILFFGTPYSSHHQPAMKAEKSEATTNQTSGLTPGVI